MPARKPAAAAVRKAAALLKTQKATFLHSLDESHLVTEAAKQTGVHRQRTYEWRDADPEFARGWAEIEERSTELLEREAYRRAAVGTDKPVYQGGELVGTIKEYSDVLLIFLLKARRPDTYRDQHRVELTGTDGGPITTELIAGREASDAAHDFIERISGSD